MFKVKFEIGSVAVLKVLPASTAPNDTKGFVQIISPTGAIIKAFTTSPDINLAASVPISFFAINVPLDSDAKPIEGEYLVSVRFDRNGSPLPSPIQYEYKSPLAIKKAVGGIDVGFSCATGNLTFGTSLFADANTRTFNWIVSQPTFDNITGTDIVATTSNVSTTVSYVNVTYQATLLLLSTYNVNDDTSVVYSNTLNKSYFVRCEISYCTLLACVSRRLDEIKVIADKKGGYDKLPTDVFYDFNLILSLANKFNQRLACLANDIDDVARELKNVIGNCDCGCDNGQPQSFSPAYPIQNINISGISPINVVRAGNNFTVSLNQTDKAWYKIYEPFNNDFFQSTSEAWRRNTADGDLEIVGRLVLNSNIAEVGGFATGKVFEDNSFLSGVFLPIPINSASIATVFSEDIIRPVGMVYVEATNDPNPNTGAVGFDLLINAETTESSVFQFKIKIPRV